MNKINELNNRKLISCSDDFSVIIYSKDNNKYTKDYKIATNGYCYCVIQTKENEICYDEFHTIDNHSICFYDLLGQHVIKKINNLGLSGWNNSLNMISEDLLLITGKDKLYIINVNQYNFIRIINVPGSSFIVVSYILNKSIFLTADFNENIKQWRIEGNNLKLISTRKNAHNGSILSLIKLRDGHILSGSLSGEIKIW